MPGNVNVRFSVQDAEVVRKALADLGKDGQAALDKLSAAGKKPSESLKVVNDVVGSIKSGAADLSGKIGIAGTALSALGPVGLATAAALGLVAYGLYVAVERANQFADASSRLKDGAEVAGLAIEQYRAVLEAGARVGLDADQTASFVQRLTVNLDQLRTTGGGPLFDALAKIDGELVRQLSTTKTTAEAWDILARAFQRTDDQFQKNALAKAIGGAKGIAGGRLLDYTAEQGGIDAIVRKMAGAGEAIDTGIIKRVSDLKAEIDATNTRAKMMTDSLFSETVLQQQLRSAQAWERVAKAAKEYSELSFWDKVKDYFATVGQGMSMAEGGAPPAQLGLSDRAERAARNRLARGLAEGNQTDLSKVWYPAQAAGAGEKTKASAAVDLALMERWTSVLGSAISPSEALTLKIAQLNAAMEKGGVSDDVRTRALESFKLAQSQTTDAIRLRLGIQTEEAALAVRLADLDDQTAKGYVRNAEERAAAERLIRKELRDTIDAQRVRNSTTPDLTRLAIDAGNLQAQLDQGLSSALRGSTADMLDMFKGTKTLGQGLDSLTSKLLDAIATAVLMKTVVAPIANVFSSGLSGIFGGTTKSANGNIFDDGRLMPFARGGVLDRPILFPMANGMGLAGEAGPEAVMPLTRGPDGKLGVGSYGGGGGLDVRVHVENTSGQGLTVRQSKAPAGFDVGLLVEQFDASLAQRINQGKSQTGDLLTGSYNLKRTFG